LLARFGTIAAGNSDLQMAATNAIDKCLGSNGKAVTVVTGPVAPACDANAVAVNMCVHREILLVSLDFEPDNRVE
jgi:hypothetical protein